MIPQTVFSLSCVPFSVHHVYHIYIEHRTHLDFPITLLFRVFLMTTASRQCHSSTCTAEDFPALGQTSISTDTRCSRSGDFTLTPKATPSPSNIPLPEPNQAQTPVAQSMRHFQIELLYTLSKKNPTVKKCS